MKHLCPWSIPSLPILKEFVRVRPLASGVVPHLQVLDVPAALEAYNLQAQVPHGKTEVWITSVVTIHVGPPAKSITELF